VPLSAIEAILNTEVISIHREATSLGAGAQADYSGLTGRNSAPPLIHNAIPCSIQAQRGGGTNPPKLPTDTARSQWFIFIPASVAPAKGTIKAGDQCKDANGDWYTVQADYWTSLGWRLAATKEQA
jgi:hypothetical protein